MSKIILPEGFRNFLVKAKRHTYASPVNNEVKLEDGSKRLTFSEGFLVYIDTYYGFNPFIGQELVLLQNKPIWGMNYSGEIVSPNLKSEEVYAFLKEALGQVSVTFPFRGPQQYQNRNFRILSGSRYISQISC